MKIDFTAEVFEARFYGIPCWYCDDGNLLLGKNRLYDRMIPWAAAVHNCLASLALLFWPVPGTQFPFPIKLVRKAEPYELAGIEVKS